MNIIMKAHWNNKAVIVFKEKYFLSNGFNTAFRLKIKVQETHLLPNRFVKGVLHTANIDIVETLGGLPNYVSKLLDDAARKEHIRRTKVIEKQLSLF